MHREIWAQPITTKFCPKWPCSICNNGYLFLDDGSFQFKETSTSLSEQEHPEWEPEWVEYCFITWATCSNPECNQHYAISGSGTNWVAEDEFGDQELMETFTPKYCYPVLDIISIPKECPDKITEPLKISFSLFYCDTNSCAGKIRCTIESIMCHFEEKSIFDESQNRRTTLHSRLEQFAEREPQLANNLMAIKWLGNAAIHDNTTVSRDDILDVYEIIEHALEKIFDQRTDRIRKKAQRLNDKYKPHK